METAEGKIYMVKHLPGLVREGHAIHIRLNENRFRVLRAQADQGVDYDDVHTILARGKLRFSVTLTASDFVEVFE